MDYADILLPLAIPPLTFRVGELVGELVEGAYVSVGVGASRLHAGVVWRLHDTPPAKGKVRPVLAVMHDVPVVPPGQMRFWEWLSAYYMIPLGVVAGFAMAAPFKSKGTQQEGLTVKAFERPMVKTVGLGSTVADEESLGQLFETLKRARAQHAAMIAVVEALETSAASERGEAALSEATVPLKPLGIDATIVKKLCERGALRVGEQEQTFEPEPMKEAPLTDEERAAYLEVERALSAGKTTLYRGDETAPLLAVVDRVVRQGGNVLILTPEITADHHLAMAVREQFGRRAIVYLPEMSERRKAMACLQLASGQEGMAVVGSRQALFMPFRRLDLVVVLREDDPLYKQNDYSPRISARDAALMLASIYGAQTILQSAVPSLESWFNAAAGRYLLVEAGQSGDRARIAISDTLRAAKRGERKHHFNADLFDAMGRALGGGGQVVLFQNRRGFSTLVECQACGWSPRCPHCNVPMVPHQSGSELKCHYCAARQPLMTHCPDCRAPLGESRGFGTEKIEAIAGELFPGVAVARLDSDTAPVESRFRAIERAFLDRRIDILVGTSMLLRDFYTAPIALTAILNVDNLLGAPDFRAAERTFRTIDFFARRSLEMVIQTSQPSAATLQQAAMGDYRAMAAEQLDQRRQFLYPPYCRLIVIRMAHPERDWLWRGAEALIALCRNELGDTIQGPVLPTVERVRGLHVVDLIVKVPRERSFSHAKELLAQVFKAAAAPMRGIRITLNIDPQ
ncbi:primosomal protein N' [Bacteroidia bacterium]|nr:primosomal protein N' [Bacteroidia bacterium]